MLAVFYNLDSPRPVFHRNWPRHGNRLPVAEIPVRHAARFGRPCAVCLAGLASATNSGHELGELAAAISPGQGAAIHAKAGELAKLLGDEKETVRHEAISATAKHFGREIESQTALSFEEAHWLLDRMDEDVRQARLARS